jgi:Flp pilus assembly pilin Flp
MEERGVTAAEYGLALALAAALIVGIGATVSNGLFKPTDLVAASIGTLLGVGAMIWRRAGFDPARFMAAFSSGASATYLLLIAFAAGFDRGLLDSMLKANSVLIFGALIYAALVNMGFVVTMFRPATTRVQPAE